MNAFLFNLVVVAWLAMGGALFFVWGRQRKVRQERDACSSLLQEIFELVGETSVVTRILSQETPEQELVRLKNLLEKKIHTTFSANTELRRILNIFPDGVVALDVSLQVIFCNPVYCEMFGLLNEEHQGKKLFEVLRHHLALKDAESFLDQADAVNVETELVTASEKTIKMRMIRVGQDSQTLFVFIFSDVSDLKKLESMRRDFVANVSHELRTPLTSIHGLIETLLAGAGEDSETRKRFLSLMKVDSERLRRLIEDLLLLSRVESQPRGFEKQKINVLAEVDEALELFALRIHQKRLALEKKIDPELMVNANADQFRQVLVNLFDNAIKFTPEAGQVGIEAQLQDLGQGIEFRVIDSGVGIHPDNREKIFQRFFREDKARSRETGGTGLGLAIVKHIVEMHGGKIRCESGPQQRGSAFIFSFPGH